MVTFWAVLSALTYGSADFFGGMASRESSATSVVVWSQGIGFFVALLAAPFVSTGAVTIPDLVWGIAAGLSGAVGVGILYKGLAVGLASVASPVAALTGAVLPVFVAVMSGERPEQVTWFGIALALPAILLLTSEKGEIKSRVFQSLRYGLLAGCGFGGFFIFIAQSGEGSGMWPLVAARAATVPVFILVTLLRKKSLVLARGSRIHSFLAGSLDMGANIFYLFAARTGYMIIAVVITALYPAATVMLQRVIRGESLGPLRIAGLFMATAGAAMIGIGG